MTLEEAKTKMCPFQQHPEKTINCIAEKCMAWNVDGYCKLIHAIPGWLSKIERTLRPM